MTKRNIALGFYQEPSIAKSVTAKLKHRGFLCFATVCRHRNGQLEIHRSCPFSIYCLSFLCLLALIGMAYFREVNLPLGIAMTIIALGTGIFLFQRLSALLSMELIHRFKNRLVADETLVIVEVDQHDIRDVLTILRQVKSGQPMTFLLRDSLLEKKRDIEIPAEPLTTEQLQAEAAKLSDSLQHTCKEGCSNITFMKRFQQSYQMLKFLRQDIADAEYIEQTVPSSAEWLLDNMYVLEGSMEDVRLNLPKKYYKDLPKIINGPYKGLPRIYVLAMELIKNTVGRLDRANIIHFLMSYQGDYPLTIGELWAFPLMLRFRLIEWVEFLAIRVDNRMREGELANFWGNRLLYASRHDPAQLPHFLAGLSKQSALSGHFAEELLDHLFDEEAVLTLVKRWLEERFESPLTEILHQEHLNETFEQVVFSNSIRSLIALSQLSWADIFEEVSPVDAILREDIAGIYSNMDFTTRNVYRDVIEEIARYVDMPEADVAKKTLTLAGLGNADYSRHVGYYLVDDGRQILEKAVGYHPYFMQSVRRWIIQHPSMVYIGGIFFISLILFGFLTDFFVQRELSPLQIGLFLFLSLLPISELSVQLINIVLTNILPTPLRPKMLFETGIPQEYRTLVVVPMLLTTPDDIRGDIESLEIRYLANTDPMLCFGLFGDFTDAAAQVDESDAPLLAKAVEGIEGLEKKYGEGKFFLFHRTRTWSKTENKWIGRERKRGKLEDLNRFLCGEQLSENIVYAGKAALLKGIRFVITLDADTQLSKDQARALVEVLSHPLNLPYLNEDKTRISRGYTIIQPRVGTDFTEAKVSWFCRIFSDPTVVDPYTQAVSNIYQDLTGEGSYLGKGIYDVRAFHTLLSGRFPEEHLLSHDLIEGTYTRVGFASHICLLDTHPKDYLSWYKRQHRWIRGDWQIIDWLCGKVPIGQGRVEKNPLSWLNRWKIFDNLRRSLLPVSLLLLLVSAWLFSSLSGVLTGFGLLVLLLPCLTLCINKLLAFSYHALQPLWEELKLLFLRTVILIALLPFEVWLSVDAIGRVVFRRLISHRHLLQWQASTNTHVEMEEHRRFLLQLSAIPLFACLVLGGILWLNPQAYWIALPFCTLWIAAPVLISIIDRPLRSDAAEELSDSDRQFLRKVGRKTWRYFDELVGPHTHWMPPDNYQVELKTEIAQRTSPTNIGLWLVALMNAYDFQYITCDVLIDKALATIQEMKKLEKHEGHFLNWYNPQTMDPLFPRYVSTVDSGNLLACLWTLKEGVLEALISPIIPERFFEGIKDAFTILFEGRRLPNSFEELVSFNVIVPQGFAEFAHQINHVLKHAEELSEEGLDPYWLKSVETELQAWESLISRYFPWLDILSEITLEQLNQIDLLALQWRDEALAWNPSLIQLGTEKIAGSLEKLIEGAKKDGLQEEIKLWGRKLQESLSTAQWLAGEEIGLVKILVEEIEVLSRDMNLAFLYNKERKLFSIGYNVDERRLDASHYDLLATEARIASLVAIAKEDVPLEHWWALGRLYSISQGKRVLLSWGGTMFEYLMPLIFNEQYRDSLIGEGCHAAVECQIAYGKKRAIPWGISESAYSAIDSHKIYQYKSFGVPGLGIKRGLEEDLVVSPYSSVLALLVKPKAAIKNLKRMAEKNHLNMLGSYGYYESIDFTRQRNPKGERGVIIYAFMAHHQGMIFSAINNVLNQYVICKRFHKDPRICGVNSLLYERISLSPALKIIGVKNEPPHRRLEAFSQTPLMRIIDTPESVTPKINLLSNEQYSLMVTNAGGGYSRWRDIEIYRWRADTTRDALGSFCYLRDLKSQLVWSTTYQPTLVKGKEYSVNFKGDKTEFRRKDHQIETYAEIVVSPEDNAEVRLITLINHSPDIRHIELTSYLELVLAPHNADRAHPAFNKLFIETEAVPDVPALLGFRRLRSPEDLSLWAAHILSTNTSLEGNIQFETDRARFIGRGRSLINPVALEGDLSNTAGTVLDPIFSLRCRIALEPGKRVQLSFVTAIADSRTAALTLIEKYKDIAASHRAIELAWNYTQLELRHLRIHQEEAQLYQSLASRLIYPYSQLRAAEERLKKNRLGQSSLWKQGISGDLPLIAVTVGDLYDVDLVKQILICHAFWNLRGLKVDLVILNEEESGYFQPLQDHLKSLIQAYAHRGQIDVPGGVFLRCTDHLSEEELNLILASARAVLIATRGMLRQQVVSPKPKWRYPPLLEVDDKIKEEPSPLLPFLELRQFNGFGGYANDGRSYVIYLDKHMHTPAPWINVLANPSFGTLVSEAGLGCTWYGNSQTNRLTPWSNDPLLDPIADTVYIRDDEKGLIWTPTPAPIRELDAYRISHSQGFSRFEHNSHGIEQELLVFVPVDEHGGLPLRIQRIRLKNSSSRPRHLTLTAYSEWVLGSDREDTQVHLMTEWDSESQALFAYNRYHSDFAENVAFSTSVQPILSYSGDRAEFLGRNSSTSNPEALKRESMSGHTGGALDSCAVLQVSLALDPGKEGEVVFILGYASDAAAARELIAQCREPEMIDHLFTSTCAWWNKTLDTLQVEVPDEAVNISMNRWLMHQNLCCRFWGRTGFYQSSGAYGFRDQLQDVMSMVYFLPEIAREYILKAASRQFKEGDVQHWWHPQTGAGIRTRCSDDLLWLPFVIAHYVRVTGDAAILMENVTFLESDKLTEGQEEAYQTPRISEESADLLEHCRRAIQKGKTAGIHGLPLIGSCDWNDGMNRVGIHGQGESVWLAWFLICVMNDFADLLDISEGSGEKGHGFRSEAKRLAEVIEATAWDGAWYRRAYFDDGSPLGSKENVEATIDSLAQSWAVISRHANPDRCAIALQSANKYLVNARNNLVLLLTPPFDKTTMDPGYIKGYPPGVRENGGQYTHGSSWLAMAFARMGNGDRAADILRMLSPASHTLSTEANALYRVEPYVIAADIYDLKNQEGRGGWTWYTGSASWIYRIWLEEVIGFKLRGQKLSFKCALPKEWEQIKVKYRFKTARYDITVRNPYHLGSGSVRLMLDGKVLPSHELELVDDGNQHQVDVELIPVSVS